VTVSGNSVAAKN